MSSEHAGPELSAYLDGELSEAGSRAVGGHLEDCASCREELETLRALSTALAVAVELDPGFIVRFRATRDRVLEESAPWMSWRRLSLRLAPIAVAAILVALAVLGLSTRQEALLDLEARALGSRSGFIESEGAGATDPFVRIAFEPFPGEEPR